MAPSPARSKKTHFHVPKLPSTIKKIPSKSHTIIFLIILLVIMLFPSQPPSFITQTILTELWEIVRLVFIGVAVSYGLFSRKTAQTVTENAVISRTDESDECLPGILNLSSVFEDGFESFCGSDENDMVQGYGNCRYSQSSDDQFLGKEGEKIGSFVSKDVDGSIYECDEKRVAEIRRSRYLKGESLVVVCNSNCLLDEGSDVKPLNLPVRSLRKSVVDNDGAEFDNVGEFSRKFEAKGIGEVNNVVKIRGVVPMNLENKFKEVAGDSLIPWRSKGGEMRNFAPSARVRPQSVGEYEFQQLKTSSLLQGSKFLSSPELASLEVKNEGRRNDFRQSGISFSRSKIVTLDVETLFDGGKTRSLSIGDSLDMNRLSNYEYRLKNFGDHEEEGRLGKEKQAVSKAKSVRTIKARRNARDEKRKLKQFETGSLAKRGTVKEPEDRSVDHQNREFGSIFPMPKPKPIIPEIHIGKRVDNDRRNDTKSEENSGSEYEKSTDEKFNGNDLESDKEFEGSEVDRKAGEFIAKFRAQISLQKTSSTKGLDGW